MLDAVVCYHSPCVSSVPSQSVLALIGTFRKSGDDQIDLERAIISLFQNLLLILLFAIFGRAIMSWFDRSMQNPISQALYAITEPFIAPIRQFMPRTGFIDLSPMVAILIIYVLRSILAGV